MATTSRVQSPSSGGIGFFGLLTIVFIILKLTGVISWSWWLVLLPVTFPYIFLLGFIAVSGIVFLLGLGVALLADEVKTRRRKTAYKERAKTR